MIDSGCRHRPPLVQWRKGHGRFGGESVAIGGPSASAVALLTKLAWCGEHALSDFSRWRKFAHRNRDRLTRIAEMPKPEVIAAFLSATAASFSALSAFLVMRIQRRNYLESVRPELVIEGWTVERRNNKPSMIA